MSQMSPDLSSDNSEGFNPEYLRITEKITRQFRSKQFTRHLDDEIESAATFGLVKALKELKNTPDIFLGHEAGFVATCVRNAILDSLTMKANVGTLPLDAEIVDRTPSDVWEEVEPTDELVGSKEESDILTQLLDRPDLLNDSQKIIIGLMRSEEGYTQSEIAAVLGVQQAAVSKQLASAIEKLRAAVSEYPLAA
jgi:RNA polymerase sigma factor (sigma-70 family)